jgi:hypothetical protein
LLVFRLVFTLLHRHSDGPNEDDKSLPNVLAFARLRFVLTLFHRHSDGPNEDDKANIITHQGDLPMMEIEMDDGSKRRLWNTFGPQQIDIDPKSPAGERD